LFYIYYYINFLYIILYFNISILATFLLFLFDLYCLLIIWLLIEVADLCIFIFKLFYFCRFIISFVLFYRRSSFWLAVIFPFLVLLFIFSLHFICDYYVLIFVFLFSCSFDLLLLSLASLLPFFILFFGLLLRYPVLLFYLCAFLLF